MDEREVVDKPLIRPWKHFQLGPILRAESFPNGGDGDDGSEGGTGTITRQRTETQAPSLYRVLLLNDDYTPMDFVIHVLQKFFQKEYTEATRIMLQVHHQGAGVAGVFSHEIAETKVYLVNQYAKQNRQPLKCTMEEA